MEYSKLASGQVVGVTSGIIPVVLPFLPNYVELDNYTAYAAATNGLIINTKWHSDMVQGSAMQLVFNSSPALISQVQTTGGISTFSAGYPQLGAAIAIASISKHATAPVVTTTGSHGLSTGNVVIMTGLAQSSTTGMQQIAGLPFVITVTAPTTFTISFNTNQSNYTALSGSPTGANVRQVLYPYLYFPGDTFISFLSSSGSSTLVSTTADHNMVVGQEVAFRVGSVFGTTQLNTPTSLGQPVYGVVTVVNSATQVTVNINSSAFTAFNSNPTVAQALAGLTWPQMLAVGDTNTGSATNTYLPTTINGPAIGGAFQNNSRQGFLIGINASGTTSDVIYWRAYAVDYPT